MLYHMTRKKNCEIVEWCSINRTLFIEQGWVNSRDEVIQ